MNSTTLYFLSSQMTEIIIKLCVQYAVLNASLGTFSLIFIDTNNITVNLIRMNNFVHNMLLIMLTIIVHFTSIVLLSVVIIWLSILTIYNFEFS